MIETIKMGVCVNAEIQHELDAIETAVKMREFWRKRREQMAMKGQPLYTRSNILNTTQGG